VYDGTSWSAPLPEVPFYKTVAVGITWFPSLYEGAGGLVHVGQQDDLGVFDGTTWTVVDTDSIEGWGNYHTFAEYNPVHDVAWLGSGNEGASKHARLDSDLQIVQLADAPVSLRAAGQAQKTYDPISGLFIVHYKDDTRDVWFEYDVMADAWRDITAAMQAALPATWTNMAGRRWAAPIDDCGVILYWKHEDTSRRVFLYKHSS
jgi:hypothetical protein